MRLALVFTIALSGCGSFTHFQTAQSMDAGKIAYDYQTATIAMNKGVHAGVRLRVGLGRGVEVGGESDIVSVLLLEAFSGNGGYGLIMGDLKRQLLEEPEEGVEGGAPFSFAVGAGGGSGFLTDFYFGQATFSRRFGVAEPYLAWRYQRIHLDVDLGDPDDIDDLRDSYLSEVFDEANDSRIGLHHVFVGVKFWLSKELYLMPEVSWIFGDADGVGSIGIAIGIQSP